MKKYTVQDVQVHYTSVKLLEARTDVGILHIAYKLQRMLDT